MIYSVGRQPSYSHAESPGGGQSLDTGDTSVAGTRAVTKTHIHTAGAAKVGQIAV